MTGHNPNVSAPDAVDEAIAVLVARRELISSAAPEADPYCAAIAALFRAEREQLQAETARIPDQTPVVWPPRRTRTTNAHDGHVAGTTHAED
jgi:hypothetical protein